MRPGVDVISRALPLPRSAPTDTGVGFLLGNTAVGVTPAPPDVALVQSLTEYESIFGDRQGGDLAWDGAEAYFREGGNRLYVARTNAGTTLSLADQPDLSDASLQAMSRSDLDTLGQGLGVDTSELPNKDAAIAAIKQKVGAAAQTVSSQEHDYEAALQAADPGIASALAALGKDYGPGQVFICHTLASDAATQSALLAHAQATNRVALLSPADGDASALQAAAAALRTDTNARYGALFAPTAICPGVAGGTTRTIPYAALEAGIIARNDALMSPNVAAAGDNGQSTFALDVTTRYTDLEYQNLNEAGVDMARLIYGGVRTYGYRTLVDPAGPDGVWESLGWARLNMSIVAQAEAIGERYVFSQIDGRMKTISSFGSDLRAMLVPMYEAGALYGATPDEAFDVNVGSQVNTPTTIANGELHAVIQVRMSPFAEWVVIEIVKVATTQAIAA